ncbi:MAG: hypothetical protein U0354_14235 [Candidatus Sericytochromatia bacterium]
MLDENYTYILSLDNSHFKDFFKQFSFKDMEFNLKDEFHLTIIGNKTGKKIKDLIIKYPKIKEFIEDKINSFEWNINYIDDFYLIKKLKSDSIEEYQYTIIQIVESKDLIELFKILNCTFPELHLDEPFPHVTLYTFNNKKGIGIYSENEFYNFKQEKITKNQLIKEFF